MQTINKPWKFGEITSHACLALIEPRINIKTGKMLVPTFTKKGHKGRMFALETGESGETVKKTLDLCLLSEVAHDAAHFSWDFLSEQPILVTFGPDMDDDHQGGTHAKMAFLVKVTGKLREDRDQPDPPDILTAIEWWEISDLLDHMTRFGTAPFHMAAAKALLNHYGNLHYLVYERYSLHYASCSKQNLTDVERAEVQKYFHRNFG